MAHKWYPERTTYTCDLCGKRISAPFDVPIDHKYSLLNSIKGDAIPQAIKLNMFDRNRLSDQNIKEITEYQFITRFREREICYGCVKKAINKAIENSISNRENYIKAWEWIESVLSTISQLEYCEFKKYLPEEFTTVVDQYFEFIEEKTCEGKDLNETE